MHFTLTRCGTTVGVYLPLYRLLNVTMIIPSNLQTIEEKLRSEWWFNIAMGEAAIFQLPNQYAKTRGSYLIVTSKALQTFVCLDPDDLRKFNLIFFGVIEPPVWVLICITALFCAFIFKSLTQGLNFVLEIAAFPVDPQKRQHLICFLVRANFVAWFWQASLSADILSIQDIPDFSVLIQRNCRSWLNKPNYGGAVQMAASFFGQNFWHGKTNDEVIYDESVDPVPWNDGHSLVEKLKNDKLTVFKFLERSFESLIWNKAHFVEEEAICKTIIFNSKLTGELDHGIRIWGLEYAQRIFRRWLEAGFVTHWKSIFFRGSRIFQGLPLRSAEGFSLPEPVPLKSAIGVCLLVLLVFQLILFFIGIIVHRRLISSWIMYKWKTIRKNQIFEFNSLNTNAKTRWKMYNYLNLLVKNGFSRLRLRFQHR